MMTKEDLFSELKLLREKFESIYVEPYSTQEKVIEAEIDLLEGFAKKYYDVSDVELLKMYKQS